MTPRLEPLCVEDLAQYSFYCSPAIHKSYLVCRYSPPSQSHSVIPIWGLEKHYGLILNLMTNAFC